MIFQNNWLTWLSFKLTFPPQCQTGFSGSINCLDINECLLNNGHGPCQDSCSNTHGGYQCSCQNLAGTVLGEDNHTCQVRREILRHKTPPTPPPPTQAGGGCSTNNGGCSHQCIDSYNQVRQLYTCISESSLDLNRKIGD